MLLFNLGTIAVIVRFNDLFAAEWDRLKKAENLRYCLFKLHYLLLLGNSF